jgi:hypothetical protein
VAAPAGSGSDPQQLLVRRLVAAGIGVVVVIVLVLGVKGCLNGRKAQALKDYNRDVASLVQDVDANTKAFFGALTTGGTSAIDVQSQINQLRLRAQAQTHAAQNLSLPGEMKPAQRSLLLALGLIEESMGKVAEKIRAALSTDSATAEPAVVATAAEMQTFLAADVLYKRRTVAFIEQALSDHDIRGQKTQDASFLPNIGWLDAPTVARRIHADAAHGAGADASTTPPAPGTHGHGLLGVSVGDVTLQPGSANRIPSGSNVTFNVKFANQGENPEVDVRVRVTVRGAGKTIVAQKTVDQTTPGNETTVAVALGQPPPLGPGVNITVEVRKVPGETNVANNSQQYPAIFAP